MYKTYDFIFNNGLDQFGACWTALTLFVLLPFLIIIPKFWNNADDNIGKILIGYIVLMFAGIINTTPLKEQYVETITFTAVSTYTSNETVYRGKLIENRTHYHLNLAPNKYNISNVETNEKYNTTFDVYTNINTKHNNKIVSYYFKVK
jgi:hypothetical protein